MRLSKYARMLVAGAVVGACSNAGADRVLTVPGVGQVRGLIFVDKDGDSLFDAVVAVDTPWTGAKVSLIAQGTVDTVNTSSLRVASLVSGNPVNLLFQAIPAGGYRVAVDTSTIPHDSMRIVRMDASASVGPGDTVFVKIAVSYPAAAPTGARSLLLKSRAWVVGVALTNNDAFGDSTISLADAAGPGAIRVTQIKPTAFIQAGDSIRMLGTVDTLDGQRVLRAVSFIPTLAISSPQPITVLTLGQAKTADSGGLDAALVTFAGRVQIYDTASAASGLIMHVIDTAGAKLDTLEVHIDSAVAFDTTSLKKDVPGSRVKLKGILLPSTVPGRWLLKPRSPADQF